jgi:Leucine-rich repeat (LRR) protein
MGEIDGQRGPACANAENDNDGNDHASGPIAKQSPRGYNDEGATSGDGDNFLTLQYGRRRQRRSGTRAMGLVMFIGFCTLLFCSLRVTQIHSMAVPHSGWKSSFDSASTEILVTLKTLGNDDNPNANANGNANATKPTIPLPSELESLTSLDLSYRGLSSVPTTIGRLTNLQRLDLGSNGMEGIPTEMGLLTRLKVLDLAFNELAVLPTELQGLTQLQRLDISHNQLASLPKGIERWSNLGTLCAMWNKLSSLPTEIGMLKALNTLDVSSNQLASLPTEVGQLASLKTLHCTWNQLTSIPTDIGQLSSTLERLHLGSNPLLTNTRTSIPSELGLLTKLERLGLDRSKVASIPSEIEALSTLIM